MANTNKTESAPFPSAGGIGPLIKGIKSASKSKALKNVISGADKLAGVPARAAAFGKANKMIPEKLSDQVKGAGSIVKQGAKDIQNSYSKSFKKLPGELRNMIGGPQKKSSNSKIQAITKKIGESLKTKKAEAAAPEPADSGDITKWRYMPYPSSDDITGKYGWSYNDKGQMWRPEQPQKNGKGAGVMPAGGYFSNRDSSDIGDQYMNKAGDTLYSKIGTFKFKDPSGNFVTIKQATKKRPASGYKPGDATSLGMLPGGQHELLSGYELKPGYTKISI